MFYRINYIFLAFQVTFSILTTKINTRHHYWIRGLCRVSVFAECQALDKASFAEYHYLPSAALGKERLSRQRRLCRVPEIWHSANHIALGKGVVSSSAHSSGTNLVLWFQQSKRILSLEKKKERKKAPTKAFEMFQWLTFLCCKLIFMMLVFFLLVSRMDNL